MTQLAPVQWAQRADAIYLTLAVSDVDAKTAKIVLEPSKLSFHGTTAGGKQWSAELEFFGEVDPTDAVRGRRPRGRSPRDATGTTAAARPWAARPPTTSIVSPARLLRRRLPRGLASPPGGRNQPRRSPSPPQASKYEVKPRSVQFHLIKKDKDAEFWPRLLKDKTKVRRGRPHSGTRRGARTRRVGRPS